MSEIAQNSSLRIDGMDCISCAINVERAVKKIGLEDARVNYVSKELIIGNWQNVSLKEIREAVSNAGYSVQTNDKTKTELLLEKVMFVVAIIVGLYFILSMFWMHLFTFPALDAVLAALVLGIGLYKFGSGAIKSAMSGLANMYVLILLGAITAFFFSIYLWLFQPGTHLYFEATAVIVALVMVGNWVEERSILKTTEALGNLANSQIQDAKKLIDGVPTLTSVNELRIKDIVQVNTGDMIPTDGVVTQGTAIVNESLLTGESEPISKDIEGIVFGGSVLNQGSIQYRVSKPVHLSTLSQINELVQKASSEKADIQKYADKVSAIFVPTIIGISAVWFAISYFVLNVPLEPAIIRSIAILVVSCPCAMGLATPIAVMVGLGKLSQEGILAKGSSTFENFASVKNLILDKTGTLTTGTFTVSDFTEFIKGEEDLPSIIRTMEMKSSHPIAQSVAKHFANEKETEFVSVDEEKGKGMLAKDQDNNVWRLGKMSFALSNEHQSEHDIYLSKNDKLMAAFSIIDEVKPHVAETVNYFLNEGITPILLSGDNERKVSALAKELNLSAKSGLSPEDKLVEIEKYSNQPTAMIGDGINDAPSLSKVNVGITFSEASNLAVQNADIVLMKDDITLAAKAHKISKDTLKTIQQNLFWAFAYNLIAIPLAAFGILSPILAAFFMLFSDIVVVGNSYRLKLKR